MKCYGRATIHEFLGDRIVYRGLTPYDRNLPSFSEIQAALDLPKGTIPRKNELDYARVIQHLLQASREMDAPGGRIDRLIFIGDTHLLDGTAFRNLCRVSGWVGVAFICAEDAKAPRFDVEDDGQGNLSILSNRWDALDEFDSFCRQRNQSISENAAVVIDMDKTMVGARGRNGQVIDQARMAAVQMTVAELLGEAFNLQAFERVYEPLNQPEFHPFTGDNQDYLAYICLILGSGLMSYEDLIRRVRDGSLQSFRDFLAEVSQKKAGLPGQLDRLHDEINGYVQAGDPTPFKPFRRNEYRLTFERFGLLQDNAAVSEMLKEEIVITQEVRRKALEWRSRGALLFGLSDKPEEASLPTAELAQEGYVALHRAETHAIGS